MRFGIAGSSLFAAVTTVTSCGAVNAAMESLTGIGGAIPMASMMTGEVVFGGVGSGLASMLLFVLLAVFIAGLMVGRTPEYLGKKIGAREVKLTMFGTLAVPLLVLVTTAVSIASKHGKASLFAHGPQGFSETLYAYASQANNNGSAFAGYTGFVQPHAPGNAGSFGITFADLLGSGAMLAGRFLPLLAVLAVAGALAGRQGRSQPARARCAPTRRRSSCCSSGRSCSSRCSPSSLRCCSARSCRASPGGPSDARACAGISSASLVAIVVFTALLGLGYPLLVTGIAQVAFPGAAQGSLVRSGDGDHVVGSRLLGQDFKGDPRWFQSRPSQTAYDPSATAFSNAGPNGADTRDAIAANAAAYLKRERRYVPTLTPAAIPPDAVQTSASGVDPHISTANARDPGTPHRRGPPPAARARQAN